jgi:dTDP-4-amino-4,6-dideoxygalactose transaminase
MYRMGEEEIDAVARVIRSKILFMENDGAQEVRNFEAEWSRMIGVEYTVCMSGGTPALVCALAGLGIGPGDEVIVPAYTFMASAAAVLIVGGIPVLADVDDSLTLDPAEIERKRSRFTKAVMPVHMVGFPCDMSPITEIARRHSLVVVEDCCQADGGSYRGRRLGSIGDAGAFSFNYFKIMSAGEGGATVTNDRRVYERATIYHDGGSAFRQQLGQMTEPVFIGDQYRISEITGAILRVQTRRLDGMLQDLRRVKRRMMDALSIVRGVRFVRSNDMQGDCGSTLGLAFDTERRARKFATSAGVRGWLPIDSGKHVYTEWTPVLAKAGGHHPAMNPYTMTANAGLNMTYDPEMCRRTLDYLRTSVYISLDPDWSEEVADTRAEACVAALKGL